MLTFYIYEWINSVNSDCGLLFFLLLFVAGTGHS